MYTRNFEAKANWRKDEAIPVQSFDDTFSADAFMKSEKKAQTLKTEQNNTEESQICSQKSVSSDELLVLFLILLLLGEKDIKESVFPIALLSMLLL